jgi:large subunit ribosomal protein L4
MANIDVVNLSGKKVGSLELADEVFGAVNEALLWEAVKHYRAAQRAGTHATKNRKLVSGSGKKLWRQKGTGRARTGDIRNPKWRKGGTVHGPVPRSYEKDLSRREKRNALKSALSQKLAEESIVVLEGLELGSHKTRDLIARLGKLGIAGKALLVDSQENRDLSLAARNAPALKAVDALAVNVYDVVDRRYLVLSEDALGRLVEVLAK